MSLKTKIALSLSLSAIAFSTAAQAQMGPRPPAGPGPGPVVIEDEGGAEIIMRRPLPSLGATPVGEDTGDPVIPDDPFDPDEEPDLPLTPSGAFYYATGVCNGGTIDVSCTEMSYTDEGLLNFRENVGNGACALQDPSSFEYTMAISMGPRPENSFIVAPSNVASTDGDLCSNHDVTVENYYVVGCDSFDMGGILQTFGYCMDVNIQTHNGETSESVIPTSDENCTQDASYASQPGYSEILDKYFLVAAGPDGLDVCESGPPRPDDNQGFFIDDGVCKVRNVPQTDGSTRIETYYDWNCHEIRDFEDGPDGVDWKRFSATDSACSSADQSDENRQLIADYFAPQYKDPQDVDTDCEHQIAVLDEYRIEVSPEPESISTWGGAVLFNTDSGGTYGSYSDTHMYEESYTYYCHRYAASIYELAQIDPSVLNDPLYVKNASYSNQFQDIDCNAMAEAAAAEMALPQDASCVSVYESYPGRNIDPRPSGVLSDYQVEPFCTYGAWAINATNYTSRNEGRLIVWQRRGGEPPHQPGDEMAF